MQELEFRILNLFKTRAGSELSTSEIVKEIFEATPAPAGEPAEESTALSSNNKTAQHHRQILYYLNKLIAEGILKLSREGSKGEKFFRLALADSERFLIDKSRKRIIIEKSVMPAMPIEGYEQRGEIHRHEPSTWVDRLSSILLESSKFSDPSEFYKIIIDSFSFVNDVVALNDFETFLQDNTAHTVVSLLGKLNRECEDYGKRLCCIIDFTNIKGEGQKILEVLNYSGDLKKIEFIFDMRANELRERYKFLEKLIEIIARSRQKFYIKNQDIHPAPYFVGLMGPYTFSPKEWALYKGNADSGSLGIACAQASITIDVFKFFSEHKSASEFRSLVLACAKALLTANSLQRRKSSEFITSRMSAMPDFFEYSRNYIRFWNYGWKQPGINQEDVLDLIKTTKEEIDHFSATEETIYQSCGMPTRFKTAFSCSFELLDTSLSKPVFERMVVKRLDDLYSSELKDIMIEKERVFELFDGGDRLRFIRSGDINPSSIVREINVLLTGYKLPLVCYDFAETSTDQNLRKFMQN